MSTLTSKATVPVADIAPLSLYDFIASLFAVELREKLDAGTSGDRADAAYTFGM
jgi:hypothetical protein